MEQPERLLVGRVAKAHGIRGEVAVEVISDAPGRFAVGAQVFDRERVLTVESVRPHHDRLLIKFEEVLDRTEAEHLRGARLEIPGVEAQQPEEGAYYPHQLRGLSVVDVGGRALGTLARVEEGPVNDLWVVDAGGREVLVPAVHQIVTSVDLEAGRITLDPPEGLF